jgi:hypothetical protein
LTRCGRFAYIYTSQQEERSMKHLKFLSQKPQKAQTTLEIKFENKLTVIDNTGDLLSVLFGHGSLK